MRIWLPSKERYQLYAIHFGLDRAQGPKRCCSAGGHHLSVNLSDSTDENTALKMMQTNVRPSKSLSEMC